MTDRIIKILIIVALAIGASATQVLADTWNGSAATIWTTGSGTTADPFLIQSAANLAYLKNQVNGGTNYSGKYFKLSTNINLNNYAWMPIGSSDKPFKGNFDGDGHTISGINVSGSGYAGLFGYVYAETASIVIKNLTIAGSIATTSNMAGGFVGYCNRTSPYYLTIDNCTNECSVDNTAGEGCGICGGVSGKIVITNCTNNGTVSGTAYVAGIVGYPSSGTEIKHCINNANITSSAADVAGIVAYILGGVVEDCVNNGNITNYHNGSIRLGGIVATLFSCTSCKNCENYGDVRMPNGNSTTSYYGAGGICGVVEGYAVTEVINCNNHGSVIAPGNNSVGGIVGCLRNPNSDSYPHNVRNCYSSEGTIQGTNGVGGIVGYVERSCHIVENCYNASAVSGTTTAVGSIVGRGSGPVNYCYWLSGSASRSVGSGGTQNNVKSFTHTLGTTDNVFTSNETITLNGTTTSSVQVALSKWVNGNDTYLDWTARTSVIDGKPIFNKCTVVEPTLVIDDQGDRFVKLRWDMVDGVSYKLYYGINNPPSDGWVTPQNVTPPYTVPRLTNGQRYYFAIKPTGDGTTYCADNPLSNPAVEGNPNCE